MKTIEYYSVYPAMRNYYYKNGYKASDECFWPNVFEEAGLIITDTVYLRDPLYIKDEIKFTLFMLKYSS